MARRLAFITAAVAVFLAAASPAMAFQHDRVSNPLLHWALDIASLAVVVAPVWTAVLWARGRDKWLLAAVVGAVQAPVAILAFVPAVSHGLKGAGLVLALSITVAAIVYTRRAALERAVVDGEDASQAARS
jgi:uncharacterized membrane protein